MNSKGYRLKSELDEGLVKYGRDYNLSPLSIIEELVEGFLTDKDYLCIEVETVSSKPERITNAQWQNGGYVIRKFSRKGGKGITRHYGVTKSPLVAKEIVSFLKEKEWDSKYTIKNTGLKGTEQINFLLNEIEKERSHK